MSDCTLVIMAAGMGSRYGGIKQLEPVGPSGEIIMDYSVYDALEAGFNKVVFIIRNDIKQDFIEIIGNRMQKLTNVEYVYQELDSLPVGFHAPEGRVKPWGTGQAILNCKDVVDGPFVVINADDYYGKEAFHKVHDFLSSHKMKDGESKYCMAGFHLGNTLSDHGAVTRGICQVNEEGILLKVDETSGIIKSNNGAVVYKGENKVEIDGERPVSMNMWGFYPDIFPVLSEKFEEFLMAKGAEMTSEFLIPIIIDELIKENRAKVHVLDTKDTWFGVTYKEDKEIVKESFRQLVEKGIYPKQLFS